MDTANGFYAPQATSTTKLKSSVSNEPSPPITFSNEKNEKISYVRSKSAAGLHFSRFLFYLKQPHFFTRLAVRVKDFRRQKGKSRFNYVSPVVEIEQHKGCVLECSGCLLGTQNATGYPHKISFTNFDIFKKEIDRFYKGSFRVHFHLPENSLMNKIFYEACDYAASKGLWTVVHCHVRKNFVGIPDNLPLGNIHSLQIDIDSESHENFRLPGKSDELKITCERIRKIANEKITKGLGFPNITVKVSSWNPGLATVRYYEKVAIASGADEVMFERQLTPSANNFDNLALKGPDIALDQLAWEPVTFPEKCPFHWEDLYVGADGKISTENRNKIERPGLFKSLVRIAYGIVILARETFLALILVPFAIIAEKFRKS